MKQSMRQHHYGVYMMFVRCLAAGVRTVRALGWRGDFFATDLVVRLERKP